MRNSGKNFTKTLGAFALAMFLGPSAFAQTIVTLTSDIQAIQLVESNPYNPEKTDYRSLKVAGDAFKLFTLGNIYKATTMDMKKDILDVLNNPDLKSYFPTEKEKMAIAEPIAKKAQNEILAGTLTNDKSIKATNYLFSEVVKQIVDRSLDVEGIVDPQRRVAWSAKILAPFQACIAKAKSHGEAMGCKDAYQQDIPANIGLAIAYETSMQELGEKYTKGKAEQYLNCLKPNGKNDPKIRSCVMSTIRTGIQELATDKINDITSNRLKGKVNVDVQKEVIPALGACLEKAQDRAGFMNCTDSLVIDAGKLIVQQSIINDPEVITHIPKLAARNAIAQIGTADFSKCMQQVKASNKRDGSGTLDTSTCERFVTNSVAKTVALSTFNRNIQDSLPGDEEKKDQVFQGVNSRINTCWNNQASTEVNSVCLTAEIKTLARDLADARLDKEIPSSLSLRNPQLKQGLLTTINKCLVENLPKDLITSPKTAVVLDFCTASLMRVAALAIADNEIRETVKGNLNPQETDLLAEKLVLGNFKTCLGLTPDSKLIDKCSMQLRQSAAMEIAQSLFPKEIDKFISAQGGKTKMGITLEDRNAFVTDLLAKHQKCLNVGLDKQTKANEANEVINSCFKSTIQLSATHLASITFKKLSMENLGGASALQKQLQSNFDSEFETCLNQKNSKNTSIEDFKTGVDECANSLSRKYTIVIGKARLSQEIAKNIDLSKPATQAKAKELESNLSASFDACMNMAPDATGRDKCISAMERNATQEIVLFSGRDQLATQLLTTEVPKEVAKVEDKLKACMKTNTAPTECAKTFAIDFAKSVGMIKFRLALGGALGAKEYNANINAVQGIEKSYNQCLDGIKIPELSQEFLAAVQLCTVKLQDQSIAFIQLKSKDWILAKGDSAQVKELKEKIALTLPCLNGIMPDTPYSQKSMTNVDPDGVLKGMVMLIGDYVSYDVTAADKSFDLIVKQLTQDLKAAGPEAARTNLVKLLSEKGVLDQLVKAMVFKEIKGSFSNIDAADRPSAELQAKLLSKKNFDLIFNDKVLASLRPAITNSILSPVLVQGKSLKSPELMAAQSKLKGEISNILLRSPQFGVAILNETVQRQLDNQDAVTKFFANLIYGNRALDWSYVRTTPKGKAAEIFIRDQILKPKFLGQSTDPQDEAERRKEAEDLIKKAVQNS